MRTGEALELVMRHFVAGVSSRISDFRDGFFVTASPFFRSRLFRDYHERHMKAMAEFSSDTLASAQAAVAAHRPDGAFGAAVSDLANATVMVARQAGHCRVDPPVRGVTTRIHSSLSTSATAPAATRAASGGGLVATSPSTAKAIQVASASASIPVPFRY